MDIGTFQIPPRAKMAAILQNGRNELQILPSSSALSYVLGAKHNVMSILLTIMHMLCIYFTFDSKSESTVTYEGQN